MLYCLWTSPAIRAEVTVNDLTKHAKACTTVLDKLSKTWTVAASAQIKFDRLVHLTIDSWKRSQAVTYGELDNAVAHSSKHAHSSSSDPPNMTPDLIADGGPHDQVPQAAFADYWNEPLTESDLPVPDLFMGELGDMSTWFDLDWLGDVNYSSLSLDPV